jgi:uncharacterized protein YhaN
VRILRVEIEGFGKLNGLNVQFAPHINVFFGENEAGKSTFQQAILSLLYGFYEGSRAAKSENERWQKYRPWQGGPYRGALEYVLDDGNGFRVERGFESDDIPTKIIDSVTGRDVTDSFGTGRHGNVPFTQKQLGMSRAIFASTCFIDQGAITSIERGQTIGDAIAALADTAKPDVSATKAAKVLDGIIKHIGTERSRTAPWAIAKRDVEKAKEDLRAYQEAKECMQKDAKEREDLSAQLQKLTFDIKKTRLSIVYRKIEEIEDRLRRIAAQEKALAEAVTKRDTLQSYASFPIHLFQDASGRRQLLRSVQERLEGLKQRMSEKESEVRQGNNLNEHEQLRAAMDQLTDTEFQLIQETQNSLNQLSEKITEEQMALEVLKAKRPSTAKPWLVILMILLPPIGIPLFFWRRAKAKKHLTKERVDKRNAIDLLLVDKKAVSGKLDAMLARYQTVSVEQLYQKRLRYLELAKFLSEYNNLKSQINDVGLDADAQRSYLIQIFKTAGVHETDFEKASALFDEAYGGKLRYDQASEQYRSADTQKRQILGRQAVGELVDGVRELSQERDVTLANNPQLAGLQPSTTLEEFEKDYGNLNKERERLEGEKIKVDERIRSALSGHRGGAELEENLGRCETELSRLTISRQSLELAKEMIETVAGEIHREFAPQLGAAIGSSLAAITDSRYTTVQVDPTNLRVSVRGPATDRTRAAEDLSFGTTEQIYLLLRVELARLMSSLHERVPFFFDDAFVNFDATRLGNTLKLIQSISLQNQIMLFSKDKQIIEWFDSYLAGDSVYRLFMAKPDGSIVERT